MNLTSIDMCAQIGRYLGRQLELSFVEPTSSEKGTIYATQLPRKKFRNTPAVSIIEQVSARDEQLGLAQRMGIVLHAEALSNAEAMRLLASIQSTLFPNNRPTLLHDDIENPGVIGIPSEVGIHPVWRLIELSLVQYPQTQPRSPSGQAVAEMFIEAYAVQHTVTVTE